MAVNIVTLKAMKKSEFAMPLYETLGKYIFSYLLSDNHSVDDKIEEETVDLLKQCNKFARENGMHELCSIYDVFGLEQDAMIIYHSVVGHLVKKNKKMKKNNKLKKLK